MNWLEQDRRYWRQQKFAALTDVLIPSFAMIVCLAGGYEIGRYFAPERGEITCNYIGEASVKNITFNTTAYKENDPSDLEDLRRALQSAVCKRNFVHS